MSRLCPYAVVPFVVAMARPFVLAALFVSAPCAFAYPRPPEGTENIPPLIADSTLVCKGEVVDRCFKGERPASEIVAVLFR
jgi:hypothetical protein